MEPRKEHEVGCSTPTEARALFVGFACCVVTFTDNVELLADFFQFAQLMVFEGCRFFGALFDKLGALALARGGEFRLLLLPLFVGIFE